MGNRAVLYLRLSKEDADKVNKGRLRKAMENYGIL